MSAADWGTIVAAVAAVASATFAWRALGNAASAKLEAKAAADRSDEALNLANGLAQRIQTHLAGREEREQAKLAVPAIRERWEAQIIDTRHRAIEGRGAFFTITFDVPDQASRIALNAIREEKDRLGIHSIDFPAGETRATLMVRKLNVRNRF
jgi:hypothetical protein